MSLLLRRHPRGTPIIVGLSSRLISHRGLLREPTLIFENIAFRLSLIIIEHLSHLVELVLADLRCCGHSCLLHLMLGR